MDEILKANAQEFGISEEDMNKIKESVATHKEGLSSTFRRIYFTR